MDAQKTNPVLQQPSQDLEISRLLLDTIPPMMRSLRLAMREAKRGRLTVPQFRVLAFVTLQPRCTSKQLAEWQGVSGAAMSRMVDALLRRQLLVRTPDADDRRQMHLRVSPKGKREFENLQHAVQAKLAKRIARLQKPEKESLEAGLNILGGLFQ